jgi:hypothetical protein
MHGLANVLFFMFTQRVFIQTLSTLAAEFAMNLAAFGNYEDFYRSAQSGLTLRSPNRTLKAEAFVIC